MKIRLNYLPGMNESVDDDEFDEDVESKVRYSSIACFCLHIVDVENERKDYHLVRDLFMGNSGGPYRFNVLAINGDFNKIGKVKEEDIPLKRNDETFLEYLDRMFNELNGTWVFCEINGYKDCFIRGRVDYFNDIILTQNSDFTKYMHAVKENEDNVTQWKKP